MTLPTIRILPASVVLLSALLWLTVVTLRRTEAGSEVASQVASQSADASGLVAGRVQQPAPAGEAATPELVDPVVPKVGGVVVLPRAVDQPRKGAKLVLDVTADAKPAEVNKGLERAARLLNLYGAAGLKASDVTVTVILHGQATKSVLTDAAYQAKFGTAANPNLPVIAALQKHGVEVLVCGQALAYKGFQPAEVSGDVGVAVAALTVIANRQSDGYAYVPVP